MHALLVILLSVITSLATTAGSLYVGHHLGWVWHKTQVAQRAVPNLIGLTELDARTNLEASGLRLMVGGREAHPTAMPGTVVGQSMPAGQLVSEGQAIALTLASELADVPDVTGLDLEKAQELLKNAGYSAAIREATPSGEVAKGLVVRQSPAAGRPQGVVRVVTLHPSAGPDEAEVPKIVGMKFESAKSEIEKGGFKVGHVQWVDLAETQGLLVLRQTPKPGEKAKPESEIAIVVNRGD